MTRTSRDQYKLETGEMIEVSGIERAPKGATLWNGYNYTTQQWYHNGTPDIRTLEQLREEMYAA